MGRAKNSKIQATVALRARNTGVLAEQFFANENYDSQDGLKDLLRVEPGKPMGYLPLETIRTRGRDPIEVTFELEASGLQTRTYSQNECGVGEVAVSLIKAYALSLQGRDVNGRLF